MFKYISVIISKDTLTERNLF